jgi:endo-1,3(4)-beta-glucanase
VTDRRRAAVRFAAVAAAALLLAGCAPAPRPSPVDKDWAQSASAHAADLAQRPGPYSGTPRLATDIRPPTNSWVSGPVFGTNLPAYTGMLAVTPRPDGFAVGLPTVEATPSTVFASAPDSLVVTAPSSGVTLTALDDLVARWALSAAGSSVGDLVAAEGWPYVAYTASASQVATVSGATERDRVAGDLLLVTSGGIRYGLVAPAAALDGFPGLTLAREEHLFIFAVPKDATAAQIEDLRGHAVPLESGTISHASGGDVVTTEYALHTAGNAPTLFGALPDADVAGAPTDLAYDTLYGEVRLRSGTTFTRSTPAITETASLDLSGLSANSRATLRTQVRLDTAATKFTATDTYDAGKQLYRAATLRQLAVQLGMTAEAATLRRTLIAQFDLWLDPAGCAKRTVRCFVYDPVLGGIVGQTPAYGSDEFNDHHFDYGYFLAAIGMLAATDPALVDRYRTVADLLALDIASPVETAAFPRLRVFDAYSGHSWASGTAQFQDGNNQESVSEAVNAWNGLALWATASGNPDLLDQARWMLSLETESADDLWLSPDLPPGFTAPFVAINWAGKRDYATFFDATPSAILGIELIPMSPATAFLPDPKRAKKLVDGVMTAPLTELPLVDYDVMLEATADPELAAKWAALLPDTSIDSADSRSYLLAWIAVQRAKKR